LCIASLANIKWEGVPDFGATIVKARSPNLSVDRGKNKSKFDADLGTVGRVESVKTGCIKLEMYDGALPLERDGPVDNHSKTCQRFLRNHFKNVKSVSFELKNVKYSACTKGPR